MNIAMMMAMMVTMTLTMIVTIGEGRGTKFTCITYTTENSSMRKRDVEHEAFVLVSLLASLALGT